MFGRLHLSMRPRLNAEFLTDAVVRTFDSGHPLYSSLLGALKSGEAMDTDEEGAARAKVVGCDLAEVQTFVQLMVVEFLSDQHDESTMRCASALVDFVTTNARISLDPLAARGYYMWALCCERSGSALNIRRSLLAA